MNRNCDSRPGKIAHGFLLFIALIFGFQPLCQAQLSGPALADVKAAAEAGDAAAQCRLAGEFMFHGDFSKAELWYRKSAAQGYAPAQGKLGDILLGRARWCVAAKPGLAEAVGSEAVEWLTMAADQGNTMGQADLAGLYFKGEFVKADLLEAYKWGDLASSEGSPFDTYSALGRSVRDATILKMTQEQLAEAKRRVAAFAPHAPSTSEVPDPAWVSLIKLSGVSGPASARLAIINDQTFAAGDTNVLKVSGTRVTVHCLEIRAESVLVQIEGVNGPRELSMASDTAKK